MAKESSNPLLSTQKSSDSGLQVTLHPLPLLEISDCITRGQQRGPNGAFVGALLGQQNGREITVEHSFTVKTSKHSSGDYELDSVWFNGRLEQMKNVHQNPPLDLVGWYSIVPKSGPTTSYLRIHDQILVHNESAILLGFHIEDLLNPASGDPLPLTIYESNLEADDSSKDTADGEDKEMKDSEVAAKMTLKFRELPYSTETGEAEMIAMQFIREGGANATAVSKNTQVLDSTEKPKSIEVDTKGKRRAVPDDATRKDEAGAREWNPDANLNREEIELLSALQAKYNAVRMMKSRVDLIVAYLAKLPPAFVSGQQSSSEAASSDKAGRFTVPSNKILRQIQALVTNIHLVTPAEQDTLEEEIRMETNDVRLINLISDLMTSVSSVREVGKKFAMVEASRNQKSRQRGDYGHSFSDVDPIQLGSSAGDLFT